MRQEARQFNVPTSAPANGEEMITRDYTDKWIHIISNGWTGTVTIEGTIAEDPDHWVTYYSATTDALVACPATFTKMRVHLTSAAGGFPLVWMGVRDARTGS